MWDSGFLYAWPDLSQPFPGVAASPRLLRRDNKMRSMQAQLSVFTGVREGILEVSASGCGEGEAATVGRQRRELAAPLRIRIGFQPNNETKCDRGSIVRFYRSRRTG